MERVNSQKWRSRFHQKFWTGAIFWVLGTLAGSFIVHSALAGLLHGGLLTFSTVCAELIIGLALGALILQPPRFGCPHCDKFVDTRTIWICGFCDHENVAGVFGDTFLSKCSNCKAKARAYCCPWCDELIFLTPGNYTKNFAFPAPELRPNETSIQAHERWKREWEARRANASTAEQEELELQSRVARKERIVPLKEKEHVLDTRVSKLSKSASTDEEYERLHAEIFGPFVHQVRVEKILEELERHPEFAKRPQEFQDGYKKWIRKKNDPDEMRMASESEDK